jgi:transcriptional regulator with XRE-family HTH domain
MGISLHEFGRRAGCNYTTASRLLSGDRAPSTRMLNRICKAFGLDYGDALRILQEDQERNDGKSTKFAAFLKEKAVNQPDAPAEPGPAAI